MVGVEEMTIILEQWNNVKQSARAHHHHHKNLSLKVLIDTSVNYL